MTMTPPTAVSVDVGPVDDVVARMEARGRLAFENRRDSRELTR